MVQTSGCCVAAVWCCMDGSAVEEGGGPAAVEYGDRVWRRECAADCAEGQRQRCSGAERGVVG
ncbi:hypothetical protein KI387_024746, partial [Taxus chinensis]